MTGKSNEIVGIPTLECPKCHTKFEIHSMQKTFPKGILILTFSGLHFGFLPSVMSIAISIVVTFFLMKWVFKPENIVIGSNVKNT